MSFPVPVTVPSLPWVAGICLLTFGGHSRSAILRQEGPFVVSNKSMPAGRGGLVGDCVSGSLLFLAAVVVHFDALRARLRYRSRLGSCSYRRTAPAQQLVAASRRHSDFCILLAEHRRFSFAIGP